ncbi:MAG: iron(III) transport system substrate-binding protein [Actinomycetota bacterium]|nr:iron(III) transport system substrate-binding protein [Actinomycetota bacterium]
MTDCKNRVGRRTGVPALRLKGTGLLLGTALLLAGCGGSPTASNTDAKSTSNAPTAAEKFFTKTNKTPDDARRDALVKQAEAEGQLDLYTSMTSDVADAVTKAFSDAFKVDVNVYRASSETVLQRILQEQKARFQGNDVVESNATEMFALQTEGYLAAYSGTRRDEVSEAGHFDRWTATRYNLFAPSWNTKKVKKGEEPKSWEDLADPKWDGQLSMEVADSDWYLTLYKYWEKQGKSKDEINKLFADMAKGAKIVKGHTVQGELMSAGQFAVTASNYSYLVERLKATGAPVAYEPFVEPVIARPNGLGLMKTAKHPAAAMLFADWLLSEDGQKILTDLGLTPSIAGANDPLAGVDVIPVDVKELLNNGKVWSDRYDKVVSGGEVVDQ